VPGNSGNAERIRTGWQMPRPAYAGPGNCPGTRKKYKKPFSLCIHILKAYFRLLSLSPFISTLTPI